MTARRCGALAATVCAVGICGAAAHADAGPGVKMRAVEALTDLNEGGGRLPSARFGASESVGIACWQNGQQIIDRRDAGPVSIGSALTASALTFVRPGQAGGLIIIQLGESLCLLTTQAKTERDK